jgi:hypothetical protein
VVSRSRRRLLVALPALVLSLSVAGCQRDARPTVLHGVLVEVEAASFLLVRSLTLRTDAGELIPMIAEGDIGMTPGHLREHMALGEPVSITVRYADELVIVTRIDDRVAGSSAHPSLQPA